MQHAQTTNHEPIAVTNSSSTRTVFVRANSSVSQNRQKQVADLQANALRALPRFAVHG